jgi:hypothetical protein
MNLENDHFKLRINVGRRSEIKEHTVELEGILDIMVNQMVTCDPCKHNRSSRPSQGKGEKTAFIALRLK